LIRAALVPACHQIGGAVHAQEFVRASGPNVDRDVYRLSASACAATLIAVGVFTATLWRTQ